MKTFEIDYGGNLLAKVLIENNEPKVISCMDGWGNSVDLSKIIIKKEDEV